MRVIQLCESMSYGDGMSNHTLLIKEGLRGVGIDTEIYSDSIQKNVPEGAAKLYSDKLKVRPDDIVLLQFGLGGRVARDIERFKCRRMLYFHNITSPHFFTGFNNKAAVEIIQGYRLAHRWAETGTFDAVLTCSSFNRDTLLELGFPRGIITNLPGPLMLLPSESQIPDAKMVAKYSDGRTNVLFVGRISPHKKQADIVRAFTYYQRHIDRGARLFLIGGGSDEPYGRAVKEYIAQIGAENVIFPGHLTDEEVLALYKCADIFLCMSEHEGFCQPIIEAMHFDIPVIAYAAAAIPETMGGTGVLLHEKDPILTAKWMEKLMCDETFRDEIIAKQREREHFFDQKRTTQCVVDAIKRFADAPWKIKEMSY